MDQNNSTEVNETKNHEAETFKITSLPQKTINKVVKNFMKCIGTLIQHVENAVSHYNGIVVTNSETIVSNDGNDIEIEEHSIKQEPDDTKRCLKNVKKCVLQLCLLCIEKNIFIECDIKFTGIAFYSCLDESTRSLVLDYLTENISYVIDHIRFIIEMFSQEKGQNEAKDIRKSLIKLYKQILLIPLNSNLDETPPAFKNLNASQWYSEARNNLTEKLNLLRTALLKLKKTFKKKIPNPETITIEDTEASNDAVKRKNNTSEDVQPKKRTKLERKKSSVHVFQVPDSPIKHKSLDITSDTDSNKSKKKKHKNKESDTETVKTKNKRKEVKKTSGINNDESNHSDSEIITELLFDESDREMKSISKKIHKKKGSESCDENNRSKRNKIDSESSFKDSNKENKNKSLNNSHQNSLKKSRSISESSDLNIENLFTSELYVSEKSLTFPNSSAKNNKEKKQKIKEKRRKSEVKESNNKKKTSKIDKGNIENLTFDDLVKNLKSSRKYEPKNSVVDDNIELDITHQFFSGLNSGDLEAEIDEEHDRLFQKLIKENNLNSNEKFLYLQEVLSGVKEQQELSEEMKNKLWNLNIIIDWDLPKAHTIETRISVGPLPDEQKALQALNLSEKRYNKVEDDIIKKNWKEFCELHNLEQNPLPFLSLRHGIKGFLQREQRMNFVRYLGKGLPNRALHSIFRRFRCLLLKNSTKSGRYTAEEDELILIYCSRVNASQQRFANIATILNRPRTSVERRYRILADPLMARFKWTLQLETEVVQALLKLVGCKTVEDLQKAKLTNKHFKKIGNAMSINNSKIKVHYYKVIYPKLFSPNVIHTGEIRTKLVNMLIKTRETDWKNIDWNEISRQFPGLTKTFLLGQIFTTVHKTVPQKHINNLGKALKYLRKHIQENEAVGRQPFTNRIIKRYCMTENGLEIID